MGLFLFVTFLLSFNQSGFEVCYSADFKPKGCEFHKKMLDRNFKSKYSK